MNRQKGGFLNTFTHTLQPYTGCTFGQRTLHGQGCPYCYVRKLPVALFKAREWGSWLDAKVNVAAVLRKELQNHERKGTLKNLRIFMSSATDPYQGAEINMELTKSCLEAFKDYPPGLLVVQTRSPLIIRDIALLKELREHVWVSVTLETNNDDVRKNITPTSPTVHSRLNAMRILHEAGIRVQAAVSPMLPNDPIEFADMLDQACSRVVVDTLFHGDGANGKRSESLGMKHLFEQYGYQSWYHPEAHGTLLAVLQRKLGNSRVVFSQEGFNTIH
ncbi:radical SAM protein [Fodinisporobacter ferrooxydans]|uniref:Radical SAM protein n=1 Tax=Fodinisporobacter ferrooxydans TaxID=2901836 RepID=A0ABY4CQZ6_9BACL|nr:radical SAM protein [Alicyclobacillaceae bacterium MYW30-H2]